MPASSISPSFHFIPQSERLWWRRYFHHGFSAVRRCPTSNLKKYWRDAARSRTQARQPIATDEAFRRDLSGGPVNRCTVDRSPPRETRCGKGDLDAFGCSCHVQNGPYADFLVADVQPVGFRILTIHPDVPFRSPTPFPAPSLGRFVSAYLHFLLNRSLTSTSPSMSHSSQGMFMHQRSRGRTSHGSGLRHGAGASPPVGDGNI